MKMTILRVLTGLTAFLILFSACRARRSNVYYVQQQPDPKVVVVQQQPQVVVVKEQSTPPGPIAKTPAEEKEIKDRIERERK